MRLRAPFLLVLSLCLRYFVCADDPGCTNPLASNFDQGAPVDGACIFASAYANYVKLRIFARRASAPVGGYRQTFVDGDFENAESGTVEAELSLAALDGPQMIVDGDIKLDGKLHMVVGTDYIMNAQHKFIIARANGIDGTFKSHMFDVNGTVSQKLQVGCNAWAVKSVVQGSSVDAGFEVVAQVYIIDDTMCANGAMEELLFGFKPMLVYVVSGLVGGFMLLCCCLVVWRWCCAKEKDEYSGKKKNKKGQNGKNDASPRTSMTLLEMSAAGQGGVNSLPMVRISGVVPAGALIQSARGSQAMSDVGLRSRASSVSSGSYIPDMPSWAQQGGSGGSMPSWAPPSAANSGQMLARNASNPNMMQRQSYESGGGNPLQRMSYESGGGGHALQAQSYDGAGGDYVNTAEIAKIRRMESQDNGLVAGGGGGGPPQPDAQGYVDLGAVARHRLSGGY